MKTHNRNKREKFKLTMKFAGGPWNGNTIYRQLSAVPLYVGCRSEAKKLGLKPGLYRLVNRYLNKAPAFPAQYRWEDA